MPTKSVTDRRRRLVPAALSAAVYAAIAAFLARDLFGNLSAIIASDDGDPVFVASILQWNAARLPLTDGWWQFPIFAPTRDALSFSEHLLGLAPLATPLVWITGDAIAAYNILFVLTFPLCGLAMFALVRRLTGSSPAAFLAGLAFAFAPYRISHLPHLHVLAAFWAPLALLGLHGYLESKRIRWLVLYAAAFALQAATSGYMLVFLSIFCGVWVAWFVLASRRWTTLAAIASATAAALLPLAPLVWKYLTVHQLHGFSRDLGEVRTYSADLAGVLCAPSSLTFWGWLHVGCRPEGELFPGAATILLATIGAWRCTAGGRVPLSRVATIASRTALVVAATFAVAAASIAALGPWAIGIGPLRLSASSIAKPVMLAIASALVALVLSPRIRAAGRAGSVPGFYAVAAILTWSLTLGPVVIFLDQPRAIPAPFALLLGVPGVDTLRVPSRLWTLTTICLAVLVGYFAAAALKQWRRSVANAVIVASSLLVLSDGWIERIPSMPAPSASADGGVVREAMVLTLPMGTTSDIAAGFRAVAGGWRSVNGYSGYFPRYYFPLIETVSEQTDAAVAALRLFGDLYVVVADDAAEARRAIDTVEGVTLVGRHHGTSTFRVPRRPLARRIAVAPERLVIAGARASCSAETVGNIFDGNGGTRWQCGPQPSGHELIVELAQRSRLRDVILHVGDAAMEYPRYLQVDTSADGTAWQAVWGGRVAGMLIFQAIAAPSPTLNVAIPLEDAEAQMIRLRQTDLSKPWSVAEIEIRGQVR